MVVFVWYTLVCYEVGACMCVLPWSIPGRVPTILYCVYFHSYGCLLARTDVRKPTKSELKPHHNHCDFNQGLALWPTYFSLCWLHCSTVTTSITKLQPVINLHIIYMSPNQHTAIPNPQITPTWTGIPLPLSNLNIFLPHPPILIWYNDDPFFVKRNKLRYGVILNWQKCLLIKACRNTLWRFYSLSFNHMLKLWCKYKLFCQWPLCKNGNILTFLGVFSSIIIFTSLIIK